MAQWIKHLVSKHEDTEDQGLDPQNPCKYNVEVAARL